jgi:hypothetical protein
MPRRRHGALSRALTTVPLRAAAVLLGLTGLAGAAACSSTQPPSPAAVTSPSRVTASATPSPSGNTAEVCRTINEAVAGDLTAFGADLGTFAGHLSGKNTDAAGKARSAALGRLTGLAGKVRTAGQQATAPRLGTAADATARNLETLAADPALLAGVHAAADVPPVIKRVTSATDPMLGACV